MLRFVIKILARLLLRIVLCAKPLVSLAGRMELEESCLNGAEGFLASCAATLFVVLFTLPEEI